MMLYFGGAFLALGLTMWTRGMIYTLRPSGKIAEKRKRRNLKVGFTTDMKLFGRKVRRLGFLIALVGALATAWEWSGQAERAEAELPAADLRDADVREGENREGEVREGAAVPLVPAASPAPAGGVGAEQAP